MQQHTRRKPMTGGGKATRLPTICDLPVPPAPPGANFSDAQQQRWDELFASAVAWLWGEAELGLVAAYVHLEAQLFDGSGTAATIREIKSLADSLGLSPASRARMGYEIGDDDGQ
ncbi:hypothetical protein [Streptomyces chiangmaiensis]|uniref:Uncharacterized protein n=1 Tax=Streptomyces chiangmaiensis TaxID=766497 RepID=A0ABU7FEL2_9ACTN|nr:hypothetical protein [Streptomyces chiangmaiensis]MED7822591.1 hypothetical protein [Streptomyces chiangmaiensis]